ncbi:MAG: FN3 associated domain-containing protein, partial [Planctomycetota bacterium]
GKAYDDYILREGQGPGNAAWYQWQLVYDTMIAQGRIDADAAARGGRGLEDWMGSHTHLDSWDVMGQYNIHIHEAENYFDVPIGANAPAVSGRSRFLGKASVVIDCFETNGSIRYTLDGSEPTERSPAYRNPIPLKKTTTVKALFCCADGRNSAVVEQTFTRVEPRDHDGLTLVPGLRYDYYEGDWNALPGFATLTPAASGIVDDVTLNRRRREERFAFRFTGYLDVQTAGRYTFHLGSDDGSRLAVDGKVVVDNDGLHGFVRRSGAVDLKPGMHEVVITFFERTGDQALVATYEGPEVSRRAIPFWRERMGNE